MGQGHGTVRPQETVFECLLRNPVARVPSGAAHVFDLEATRAFVAMCSSLRQTRGPTLKAGGGPGQRAKPKGTKARDRNSPPSLSLASRKPRERGGSGGRRVARTCPVNFVDNASVKLKLVAKSRSRLRPRALSARFQPRSALWKNVGKDWIDHWRGPVYAHVPGLCFRSASVPLLRVRTLGLIPLMCLALLQRLAGPHVSGANFTLSLSPASSSGLR